MVRRVVAGMDKDRFEVHVCSARPLLEEDHLDRLGPGVNFHSLELAGGRSVRTRTRAALRMARLVRDLRPSIVHLHSGITWIFVPALLGRTCFDRLVVEVHDSPKSGRVSRLNRMTEQYVIRRRGTVSLVHSDSVGREVVSATGIDPARVRTIPIGLPLDGLPDADAAARWRTLNHLGPDDLVVTYVGRLVRSKRPDLFVRVASEVASFDTGAVFFLAGDGPERSALEKLVTGLGLEGKLRLTGVEQDLRGLLSASDVFVSTSEYEGFGMAILEAMAAETSVVATNCGATNELVVDGVNGVLVGKPDVESMSKAVLSLIRDPDGRKRMAAAGRQMARQEFDVETMVLRYQALYRELELSSQAAEPDIPRN